MCKRSRMLKSLQVKPLPCAQGAQIRSLDMSRCKEFYPHVVGNPPLRFPSRHADFRTRLTLTLNLRNHFHLLDSFPVVGPWLRTWQRPHSVFSGANQDSLECSHAHLYVQYLASRISAGVLQNLQPILDIEPLMLAAAYLLSFKC